MSNIGVLFHLFHVFSHYVLLYRIFYKETAINIDRTHFHILVIFPKASNPHSNCDISLKRKHFTIRQVTNLKIIIHYFILKNVADIHALQEYKAFNFSYNHDR